MLLLFKDAVLGDLTLRVSGRIDGGLRLVKASASAIISSRMSTLSTNNFPGAVFDFTDICQNGGRGGSESLKIMGF